MSDTGEYKLDKMHELGNDLVSQLMLDRVSSIPVEKRLETAAYNQMFSFWTEIQDALLSGAKEIENLKLRIAELEKNNETRLL